MYLITIPEAHSSNTDDAVLPDVVFVDSSCRVFLGLDQSLSIYSDTHSTDSRPEPSQTGL